MKSSVPRRRTNDLRKGRLSSIEARYFITCAAVRPTKKLALCTPSLISAIHKLVVDKDIVMHCATVMPDHVHMLFTLGQTLTLSRVIAKYKGLTFSSLSGVEAKWQENFFDHRLRHDETVESYARYIFMNPYRADLVSRTEVWPGWVFNTEQPPAILTMLDRGLYPPLEWFEEDAIASGVASEVWNGD